MTSVARICWSLLPSTLLFAACVDAPDVGGQALAVGGGGAGGGGGGCPEWGCTGNSPTIGPYELHELDLDGAPNLEGVRIEMTVLNNAKVQVVVKGDQLFALDDNHNVFEGTGLNGLTFFLRSPTDDFRMVITQVTPRAVSSTRFWIGDPERVETYELKFAYENHPGDLRPVCRNPPESETASSGDHWPSRFEAILFNGDRYDGRKKRVTASSFEESGNWFNVGCAGSVLAKMHLNRHTTAGSDHEHETKREERQALLKMYSGDFCGEGFAFTEPGTPLHWGDYNGWRKLDGTEVGYEAWWDASGARCLTEHRLGSTYYDAVIDACHLEACKGNPFPDEWLEGAYLQSAIPAP